jgi:hypothetical protein
MEVMKIFLVCILLLFQGTMIVRTTGKLEPSPIINFVNFIFDTHCTQKVLRNCSQMNALEFKEIVLGSPAAFSIAFY